MVQVERWLRHTRGHGGGVCGEPTFQLLFSHASPLLNEKQNFGGSRERGGKNAEQYEELLRFLRTWRQGAGRQLRKAVLARARVFRLPGESARSPDKL